MSPGTILLPAVAGGLMPLLLSPVVLGFQPSGRVLARQRESYSLLDRPAVAVPVSVVAGVVSVGICVWRVTPALQPVASFLCVVLVLTSIVDIRVGRLPNLLVLPSFAVVAGLLVLAWRDDPQSGSLVRSALQTVAVLVFFTAAALLVPGSFGMGDARLLALVTSVLAYRSARGVVAMVATLGVLICAVLVWRRFRGTPRRLVPLGPLVSLATVAVLWLGAASTGSPAVAGRTVTDDTLASAASRLDRCDTGQPEELEVRRGCLNGVDRTPRTWGRPVSRI